MSQPLLLRAALLAFSMSVPTGAAEWPGFRGGAAHGTVAAESLPIHFGASTHLRWKAPLPPGHSSPVVGRDVVVVTGVRDQTLLTIALDRKTGAPRWERAVTIQEPEKVHRMNSRATPTPVTDGRAIYVYLPGFGLLAYDFAGGERWRKPLPVPKTFQNQGTGTSPILADGKLIVFLQLGNDSHLLAVNPADGTDAWRAPMPVHNNTYATPVTWRENGRVMVGLTCAVRFSAFAAGDGGEAWWVNDLGSQACSTPVVLGDRLLIATAGVQGEAANITLPPDFDTAVKSWPNASGDAVAYNAIPDQVLFTDRQMSGGQGNMTLKQALRFFAKVKAGETFDRPRWDKAREGLTKFGTGPINQTVVTTVRTGGQGDVTASHTVWREKKGVPESPSPAVWQDRAYFIRNGGMLACRELAGGRLIFDERIGAAGGYYASPVVAAGRLYVASDQGVVTVIQAGDALVVLARNDLGEPIVASPAVADQTLFVRSSGHLWAFSEAAN